MSVRPLELGVHDFQADHGRTCGLLRLYTSRMWGSEPPPEAESHAWGLV